jgi:hypothetical protein
MRRIRRVLFLVTPLAAAGCAGRHSPPAALQGETRGLYTTGFEVSHFRPCEDRPGFGARIAFDSAAAAQFQEWADRTDSASDRWPYGVYYVRWVLRDLPELPPPPPGFIRIGDGPRRAVTRILEVRAPRAGECGLPAGEVPGESSRSDRTEVSEDMRNTLRVTRE